ncbi:MAG: TetR/AcrR family transcriptional regulator [Oleispira sp.]|jgi:AcrR family transcriptional regulator|nr:TetR/AcrR family transcriptional regulator [Oleispira sp.]
MSLNKKDPRVIRTKSLIIQALVKLTDETPYKKIKIQDITQAAEIARQTFYLHYKSKDGVLVDYIDGVFENFYQEIEQHIIASTEIGDIIAWHLFNQWQQHADFAKLIIAADIEHLVIKSFRNYITRVMGLYIRNHSMPLNDPEALGFIVDYLAGASWLVLKRWVASEFNYPLEKLATLYSELSRPGLLSVINRNGIL